MGRPAPAGLQSFGKRSTPSPLAGRGRGTGTAIAVLRAGGLRSSAARSSTGSRCRTTAASTAIRTASPARSRSPQRLDDIVGGDGGGGLQPARRGEHPTALDTSDRPVTSMSGSSSPSSAGRAVTTSEGPDWGSRSHVVSSTSTAGGCGSSRRRAEARLSRFRCRLWILVRGSPRESGAGACGRR